MCVYLYVIAHRIQMRSLDSLELEFQAVYVEADHRNILDTVHFSLSVDSELLSQPASSGGRLSPQFGRNAGVTGQHTCLTFTWVWGLNSVLHWVTGRAVYP